MTAETLDTEIIEIESGETTAGEEAKEGSEVQLAAEPAFVIGGFTVTNTMTATVFTTLLIIILAVAVRRKAGVIPSRLQVLFEEAFMMVYTQLDEAVGEKKARFIAPLIVTLFLFILISNQFLLLPFVGSIVTEHGNLFRTPTTDYSLTIALAIITMGAAHLIAFVASPLGHIGNYIRVKPLWQVITGKRPIGELFNAGIEIFLGVLEMLGDCIRVISLGTRLFGNLLAGEVVIIVISGLMFFTQFLIPIPFIILASFAGLIQAFVFTLLSTLFISNNLVHATGHHE
ncbi:MAG: FoF1 ATP synthase subunit a [Candidatus Gracilibacteria bacterium]